jgi:hypothetical protein
VGSGQWSLSLFLVISCSCVSTLVSCSCVSTLLPLWCGMYARSSFLFVSVIRVFASDRLPTLVDYLSQAAKRNDRVRDRLRTEHTIVFDCLQVNLIDLNMPCQPEQSHTPDWILVTYSTSSALADLFRDAKNNALCAMITLVREIDRAMWGSLVHVAICFAGELPACLSKHVLEDCYMCGIVHSILVSF